MFYGVIYFVYVVSLRSTVYFNYFNNIHEMFTFTVTTNVNITKYHSPKPITSFS